MKKFVLVTIISVFWITSAYCEEVLPEWLSKGLIDQHIPLEIKKSNYAVPLYYNLITEWEETSNGGRRQKRVRPQNGFFVDGNFMGTNVDGKLQGEALNYYGVCIGNEKFMSSNPVCKEWNLLSLTIYEKGVKHGVSKRWGKDGKLWYVDTFEHGVEVFSEDHLHGPPVKGTAVKKYGNSIERIKYIDGIKVSQEINSGNDKYKDEEKIKRTYYPNGQIESEENYKNNRLSGDKLKYYENGQIKTKSIYELGSRIGKVYSYDESGKLIEEMSAREADLKPWTFKHYYSDGTLKNETTYVQGRKHGPYTEYYPNGKIKSKENISNGALFGMAYYYDENKKLIKKVNHHPYSVKASFISESARKTYALIFNTLIEFVWKNIFVVIVCLCIFGGILYYEKAKGYDD